MIRWLLCVCCVITMVTISGISASQESSPNVGLCMSVYFDIEKLKIKCEERIRKIDSDIMQTEENIKEANRLLAEIQNAKIYGTDKQKNDAIYAEPLAKKALAKAKETKRVLEQRRLEYLMELNRLNIEQENLSGLCKKITSPNVGGLLRNCDGDVKIHSSEVNPCKTNLIIYNGDLITTGPDGKAEMVLLGGRGRVTLENDTKFVIRENGKNDQIVELIDGRVKIDIEKREAFKRRIKDWIDKYMEDIKTIKDWGEEELKELKVWMCRKYRRGEGCVKTPWAVVGARGTSFIIDRKGDYEAMVKVLEGLVEIDMIYGKKVVLEAKNEAFLYSDGTLDLKK